MHQQDFNAFNKLMKRAANLTAMPNGKDPQSVSLALFEALSEYPFEAVAKAIGEHCKTQRFFPMLADIRDIIDGTLKEQAAEAWGVVLEARKRYRAWRGVRFPNPAFHYAIRLMGGWEELCRVDEDQLYWRGKDFKELYITGVRKARWEYEPAYFKGIGASVYDVQTGKQIPFEELNALQPSPTRGLTKLVTGVAVDMRDSQFWRQCGENK